MTTDVTVSEELGEQLAERYPALADTTVLAYEYLAVIVIRAGATIPGDLDSAWVRATLGLADDEEPGEYNLVLCEGNVTVNGKVRLSSRTETNTNLAVLGDLTASELWNDGEVVFVAGDATLSRALLSTGFGDTKIAGSTRTPVVVDNSWTTDVRPEAKRVLHVNADLDDDSGVDVARYTHVYSALKAALPPTYFNKDGYFLYDTYVDAFHRGADPLTAP